MPHGALTTVAREPRKVSAPRPFSSSALQLLMPCVWVVCLSHEVNSFSHQFSAAPVATGAFLELREREHHGEGLRPAGIRHRIVVGVCACGKWRDAGEQGRGDPRTSKHRLSHARQEAACMHGCALLSSTLSQMARSVMAPPKTKMVKAAITRVAACGGQIAE